MMPQAPRPRLDDIDRTKGLAIVLVVLGHIVAREPPTDNAWYEYLKIGIYQFHMSLFMYLSGITMFYSSAATTSPPAYRRYLARRCMRFLAPFLLFGVLIVFGKIFAGTVITVDRRPDSISAGLMALFWNTHASPATSIWYLYVLFIYCAIVPPLMWLLRGRVEMLLALAAALYWLPLPEYFYLERIGHFFIFFMLGGLASQYLTPYQSFLDRWWWLCLALFAASFALLLTGGDPSPHPIPSLRLLVIGMLSLPALHALIRRPGWNKSPVLLFLGSYALVIYLFNTMFIGATKGVMLHLMSWNGLHFLIFAPVLLLVGLIGPIVLKITVLRHIKPLDRMTT